MKGKNAKLKGLFSFILMLVIVGGVSYAAYNASMNVGKSQQKAQVERTEEVETEEVETEEAVEESEEGQAEIAEEAETDTSESQISPNKSIKLGLDLQGGVNIVYEPKLDRRPTEDEMTAARTMIQKRLDAKGYTEAEVSLEGNDRIRVDIPGVADPQKAIEEIGAAGMLRFLDQEGNEIVTGKNVVKATPQASQTEIVVSVEMDKEGTALFSEFTKNNIGNPIFIMLDESLLSYATIQAHIADGKGSITGNFTPDAAKDLADGINAGALPFTLEPINSSGIGAKLGMESLNTSLKAGMFGFILILIFMLVMYRICGLAADIALILYIGLVILVLSGMGATLTLPGIAGILLSVGMAVDANVIIFGRIREELTLGRSVPAAVDAGFSKAFSAILDGNVTTLIAAVVLYIFGTGLIKSFATTLGIGIVISMFTALVVTRLILKSFVGMKIKNPALYTAVKKTE
ncbi:protein translocase subunit SecD [Cellulosilyticum sp. I15G10I2]|uniref:protein translocase subunit SecD n=1 Tax=Cellulosilyticum sp. I15G10I2 TaxID=1892843 RepID=UPI00085BFCDF|nr:protein translocase subunit SecD [Cellulosilyticum sp. I15G10I2]